MAEVVIRPTLRAKLGELIALFLALVLSVLSPFVPFPYWLAASIALLVIVFFRASKKVFVGTLVPIALSAAGAKLALLYLSALGAAIALTEIWVIVLTIRSTKYVFKDDGLVISVEMPFYSKTRSIPKDSMTEVTVETSVSGKLLRYSTVVVKLRTGEKVTIPGVPAKEAERLTKQLLK